MKKRKLKNRILTRRLAKDLSKEQLKEVMGGTVSMCGGSEYCDTDSFFSDWGLLE
jgi:hypothetical protein